MDRRYKIVWTKRAQSHIKQVYDYIGEDSLQNASKVLNDIIIAMDKVADNPEMYAPDKYKLNNDGSYRAFEKHQYRVGYRFHKNFIRVLRVRHTKREPQFY